MISYHVDYKRFLLIYLLLLIVLTGMSAMNDHLLKWTVQAIWVLAGVPILLLTFKRFPFTHLTYFLIFIHMCILLVGAHYTYQKVPVGDWFKDWLQLSRNHFDRVGHFAQGFVPALIVREVLLRRSALQSGKWLFFLVCCVCMAISMMYEFLEWMVAVNFPRKADVAENASLFLATQGDVWDTQWDMLMASIGAITSQLMFRGMLDRQLNRMHVGH